MRKQTIIALVSICLFSFSSKAQNFEVGLFGGISNYGGDLSYRATDFEETNHSIGTFLRYNVSPRFSIRGAFTWGVISGDDRHSLSSTRFRNLNFESNVLELAVIPELNLLPLEAGEVPFTPFIFAGIAGFHFNPMTEINGEWVELQPLGTEGQGTNEFPERSKYSLTQLSIPMGGGFKLAVANWRFSLEAGFRKTFTDYLDDVSNTYGSPEQLIAEYGPASAALSNRGVTSNGMPKIVDGDTKRGNPEVNDYYIFSGLSISFLIGGGENTSYAKKGNTNYGCPSMW